MSPGRTAQLQVWVLWVPLREQPGQAVLTEPGQEFQAQQEPAHRARQKRAVPVELWAQSWVRQVETAAGQEVRASPATFLAQNLPDQVAGKNPLVGQNVPVGLHATLMELSAQQRAPRNRPLHRALLHEVQ